MSMIGAGQTAPFVVTDLTLLAHDHSIVIYSIIPRNRTLAIRIANYPDRLGPSGKCVENSTKLTCLAIIGYRIKYSTALWLVELQIRSGRKVQKQVHTVNNNRRTSNCQCTM